MNWRDAILIIGAFGWGMWFQEYMDRRRSRIEKERRIVVDMPFSSEQADACLSVLRQIQAEVEHDDHLDH